MMRTRAITKADYDFIVSIIDRWWGGPSSDRVHPVFFYELGEMALVVEDEDQIIGFLLGFVAPTSPNLGYIHLIGIHPDHRRKGVGKQLYQQFIERCQKAGVHKLKAITTVGNEGSVRFHLALGFHAAEDPHYSGTGRPRVVFTKDL